MPADGAAVVNLLDPTLQALVSNAIPALLTAQRRLEHTLRSVNQVDGAIIGTGQADFTQSNHIYTMPYGETSFQLIDVPGIEGNESIYETMIHDAIAKAHLVFYVNGSNKKPEAETAKRIKFYLRRDAAVYAISNVRGRADSYEFTEDRQTLEQTHKDCSDTVKQTRVVLEAVLGAYLQDCFAVQGALGFSSVAYDAEGQSSVNPERKDLAKAQKSYCARFMTAQAMRRFSNIEQIEQIIAERARNHRAEIIEANKHKALALINETIATLETQQQIHTTLTEEISGEIAACRATITTEFTAFKSMLEGAAIAAVGRVFTGAQEAAEKAVDEHFDDAKKIQAAITTYLKSEENLIQPMLEMIFSKRIDELTTQVATAIQRMVDRVSRLTMVKTFSNDFDVSLDVSTILTSVGFGLKEWQQMGKAMFNFAKAGFVIGEIIPFIGNIIGAALGALLGMAIHLGKWLFLGRDAKMANTKSLIGAEIGAKWEEVETKLRAFLQEFYSQVNDRLAEQVVAWLDCEAVQMTDAGNVLANQIRRLKTIKLELEAKPYGEF